MAQFQPTIRPVPLGKITPTPGTPLALNTNFTTLYQASGSSNPHDPGDAFARHFDFKNIGSDNIYIGTSSLNKTTLAGVIWILGPGESYSIDNPQQPQPYHVGDYYVDCDAGGVLTGNYDPS